jgi:signal transduction histidine kinase
LSRIQTGNIAFEPGEMELKPIIEEIFSLFAQNAKSKNIQLVKTINSGANVVADQNMIKTILRNLISNGIKFTNDGGTVSLSVEEQNDLIKISVIDSGVGIYKENINKLFRIDGGFTTPGTNKERGTGLGLVLCKELVEKNGGKISVESEPGRETKFIFTLPKQ